MQLWREMMGEEEAFTALYGGSIKGLLEDKGSTRGPGAVFEA